MQPMPVPRTLLLIVIRNVRVFKKWMRFPERKTSVSAPKWYKLKGFWQLYPYECRKVIMSSGRDEPGLRIGSDSVSSVENCPKEEMVLSRCSFDRRVMLVEDMMILFLHCV